MITSKNYANPKLADLPHAHTEYGRRNKQLFFNADWPLKLIFQGVFLMTKACQLQEHYAIDSKALPGPMPTCKCNHLRATDGTWAWFHEWFPWKQSACSRSFALSKWWMSRMSECVYPLHAHYPTHVDVLQDLAKVTLHRMTVGPLDLAGYWDDLSQKPGVFLNEQRVLLSIEAV